MPKTIVKFECGLEATGHELIVVCDESYGNEAQARMGLNLIDSMPKHRGMIFYLDYEINRMEFGGMNFKIDAIPIVNARVTAITQVSSKIWIEMNIGLMKEYSIVDGTPVSIKRVLGGDVDYVGDLLRTR